MGGILELSVLILMLGARGFTSGGIPLTSRRNIRGRPGRLLGSFCLLLGLLGIGFAYWGTPPAGRRSLESFGQGVVVGLLGAIVIFGNWIRERLPSEEPPPENGPDHLS